MKAALRDRYGPPEVVEMGELERPVPAEGEVLVRVGPHRSTGLTSTGFSRGPNSFASSWDCGRRGSRRSARCRGCGRGGGPGVTRFGPATRSSPTCSRRQLGAFAEYVSPEKAWEPIPPGMSFEDAATLGHSSVLASRGCACARVAGAPGHRVLVGRIGQCRSVRGPDREGDGRGGDRRLQQRQGRLRALARRR